MAFCFFIWDAKNERHLAEQRTEKVQRRQARHVCRQLTPEEQDRVKDAREQAEAEKEEIIARGRQCKAEHDAALGTLSEAFRLLKAERVAQGLTLGDIERTTGINRPALSRLERDAEANPTIATLTRYADALGKRLVISLADRE